MSKYTLRQLRQMVNDGIALDITSYNTAEAYALQYADHPQAVGVSVGTYGVSGKLLRGVSGGLYAITRRTTALYCF